MILSLARYRILAALRACDDGLGFGLRELRDYTGCNHVATRQAITDMIRRGQIEIIGVRYRITHQGRAALGRYITQRRKHAHG